MLLKENLFVGRTKSARRVVHIPLSPASNSAESEKEIEGVLKPDVGF